jgi:hypothetical protein
MEEKQRRRYCHGYHRPDGEELNAQREEDDDHYLEDPITLEPVPLEQDIVMFINERYNPENVIIECYTVDTIRNVLRNLNIDRETGGVRNVLSATNRIINRNFIQKFNRGNRTFILREENRVFNPISINRADYFNLLNRIVLGEENHIQNEEEIRREIQRITAPPVQNDLIHAVQNNNMEMVRFLVQNGIRDNFVIVTAVKNNNMEMVRFLVENGMDHDGTVTIASENNNMEMVRFLVENGMRDNFALIGAVEHNNMEMARFLIENGMRDNNAITIAFKNNNMVMLRFLLENDRRISPEIRRALENNDRELLGQLIFRNR